jgi:hypothetical protein
MLKWTLGTWDQTQEGFNCRVILPWICEHIQLFPEARRDFEQTSQALLQLLTQTRLCQPNVLNRCLKFKTHIPQLVF